MKLTWCLLTGFHNWVKLVIPANSWGDPRYEGFLCKQCGKVKDLKQTTEDIYSLKILKEHYPVK